MLKIGKNKWTKVFLWIFTIVLLGILVHVPLFFLYPNYNIAIEKNISDDYFHELAIDLKGDCYRISNNFEKHCPFPTREIHLSSSHTIVEININNKWYAYDPMFQLFFDGQNAMQISFDINRGYIPDYLQNYKHTMAFKKVHFYHHWYFI